jgi:hypothetical protein
VSHWNVSAREGSLLLLVAALLLPAAAPASDGGDDLLSLMGRLQTLGHKLQLSLDSGNRPLAGFYAHELEEVAETVAGVERYDGQPVGALTRTMLLPQIAAVNASLREAAAGVEPAIRAFERLVAHCNACHAATGHAFIVIERNPANPYAQSFAPR